MIAFRAKSWLEKIDCGRFVVGVCVIWGFKLLKIGPGLRVVGFNRNAPKSVFTRPLVHWLVRVAGVHGTHC